MNVMPIVNSSDFQGDVLSNALKNRVIYVTGEIDDTKSTLVNAQIQFLASQSNADIRLYVNSPGGSVTSGLSIVDTMRTCGCDVQVVVAGIAASMAAIIVAAGTPGKRRILPHSLMMIHQPSIGHVSGKESDIKVISEYITGQRKVLDQMLADFSNQPLKKVKRDTQSDYYLTASEAVQYGLVDSIVGEE